MEIKELRDKRNKLMHDAQALCLKADRTAEELASAEKMVAEAEEIQRSITVLETTERAIKEAERSAQPPVADPSDPTRANPQAGDESAQRKEAFRNYVRFGVRSNMLQMSESRDMTKEQRDLLAGSGGGAYLVPQEFYPVLIEAKKAWGSIINVVSSEETDSGAPMKMAFDNDTGNLLHESGEPASISEKDPSFSSDLLQTDMLDTGVVKVSLQQLQDSGFDIDKFIRNRFGKRYYRGLTQKITAGSTSGNIGSIVSGAYNAHVSGSPTKISWGDIAALYAALDPAYQMNAKWSCNSRTVGKLLGVTDSFGRPLYIPAPTAESFDTLLGKPVVQNQYLDDIEASNSPTTDVVALQFGDFEQGYLLRTVKPGLAIVRLNERYMDTLEVGFIGYVRAGGVVTDAGTHPIVNLVQAN